MQVLFYDKIICRRGRPRPLVGFMYRFHVKTKFRLGARATGDSRPYKGHSHHKPRGKQLLQNITLQQPLLFDGAMGTYYSALSQHPLERCEPANYAKPSLIAHIHRAYIKAGAHAIKTNSFGIAAIALESGIAQAESLIDSAWSLANKAASAAGRTVHVFADIGPAPRYDDDTATLAAYKAILDRFLTCGARNFLFETFADDALIRGLISHIRAQQPKAFILTTFAVQPDGFTERGCYGRDLIVGLIDDCLADAAGFNCVSGPGHLLRLAREIDTARYPLAIMPNAGYPAVQNGRTVYESSPAYFAARLAEMANAGAKILGGCCGTDPAYIAETALALARKTNAKPSITVLPKTPASENHAASTGKNRFCQKLEAGQLAIAVELDSPLDADLTDYMARAKTLQSLGADSITIADCPVARARMDSSIVACKIHRELGLDAVPHLTCRDRNLNATRALLLGLAGEGVHNVLIVTGDPVPTAERDLVKSVYNFNSRLLARYIQKLNDDVLQTPFFISAALNVNAPNFEAQLRLAEEKIENGVGALFTQPIMTARAADNLKRARDTLDVNILGGIMPIVSYRNAQFIASEVQGMDMDAETVELFHDKSKEECAKISIGLCIDTAAQIRPEVDGYYLITPFGRVDMIGEIMKGLKV